jgi:putative ABC transport system permease protein
MGRTLAAQEEQPGAPGVAVLSEELWRSRFAADPNILGKAITVEGIKRNVIGVMPAGFAFPGDAVLWLPLSVGADPGKLLFPASLRPPPAVVFSAAGTSGTGNPGPAVSGRAEKRHGRGDPPSQGSARRQDSEIASHFHGSSRLRAADCVRQCGQPAADEGIPALHEMAVRTALGAPRSRLIPQLLTESALLSLGGAAAGLLLAILGVRGLLALAPAGSIPRIAEIHLAASVLAFALGLGAVTGILFGLLPAVHATGRELRTFLSHVGRSVTGRSEGLRGVLVVSEIALALVLLTGARAAAQELCTAARRESWFPP